MQPPTPVRVLLVNAVLAAFAVFPALAAPPPPAPGAAQSDNGLVLTFNAATAAFAAGDYAAAAAGMEKVVAQAPADSNLESVYYTLGASYFNLTQYPKAIDALRAYRAKFPNGPRLAEVSFSLGQAALLTHDYATATETFKALENNPAYREQALFYEGSAQKEAKQSGTAAETLEKLVSAGIRNNLTANGALMLASLYAQGKQADKAVALIAKIRDNSGLLDNVMQINSLATETGDALLQQNLPRQALACYRVVRSRAEIIKLQSERIIGWREEAARAIAAARADPARAAASLAANSRLQAALAEATQRLADFQKLPNYEPALLMRLASCFNQMDRKWEAIVAYEELRLRFPDDPGASEPALYGVILASIDAGRLPQAHDLCEQYLKGFPHGPNADAVGYLTGVTALQANDPRGAASYFGRMLETQPGSVHKESIRFLLGNAQFAIGEYDKAQETYAAYRKEFPQGENAEEAVYRGALCAVFSGAYEKAVGLLNDYAKTYPNGQFVPDARYRLAVCLFAASQNDEVIARCREWEKNYGSDPMLGEVLALEADALAAKNDNAAAVEAYVRASKAATTEEVADYALFAAQKLLQKQGDWPRMTEMFKEFVRDHPERPSAVMAVYWIGKAAAREGKTEEAKRFTADTIKKYIADPKREAVEQLLTQLATLCVRRKTPLAPSPVAAAAAGTASPAPSSSPAPSLAVADAAPPADPSAELDALLGGAETAASPLARARVLFAKSELARLQRQTAAQDQALEAIATTFKPPELSAPLLALAGDYLLGKGRCEQAAPLFSELIDTRGKSSFLDYAYNGLGEAAYQRKDYPQAVRYFTDAVDKAAASAKLKDVTLGKAKTLLAMDRLDEAKPLFEQVASTREWRGESTACAVYSLGDIMRKQGKLPEAIAYYQRVYVAYQRYLPWVARAYIASAECFRQMGKKQEALNTYQEMVKNPKLQDFAETQAARDYLQKNGQG